MRRLSEETELLRRGLAATGWRHGHPGPVETPQRSSYVCLWSEQHAREFRQQNDGEMRLYMTLAQVVAFTPLAHPVPAAGTG